MSGFKLQRLGLAMEPGNLQEITLVHKFYKTSRTKTR
jgi:hypothetical protein